jgi:ribonuclease R
LDDAISLEKLENQKTKLYVHIADVTHFVKENSALDLEAKIR